MAASLLQNATYREGARLLSGAFQLDQSTSISDLGSLFECTGNRPVQQLKRQLASAYGMAWSFPSTHGPSAGRGCSGRLRDTDFYLVGDARQPCARIVEDDVRRVLPALGFDMGESIVEGATVSSQHDTGLAGVVMAVARKRR